MKLFGNTSSKHTGHGFPESAANSAAEPVAKSAAADRGRKTAPQEPQMYLRYEADYAEYRKLPPQERERRVSEAYRNTPAKARRKSASARWKSGLFRGLIVVLAVLLLATGLYHIASYSTIPWIAEKRNSFIETAWETMSHRYAAFIFPTDVVNERVEIIQNRSLAHIGENSEEEAPWLAPAQAAEQPAVQEYQQFVITPNGDYIPVPDDVNPADLPEVNDPESIVVQPAAVLDPDIVVEKEPEKAAFYAMFRELNYNSMEQYLADHPEALANGYDHIYINEAGLNDDGTDIVTQQGDQVLAVDAENRVLVIRIWLDGSRGVLALAKDPSRLHLCESKGLKTRGYGQTAGVIAENNNGVLALTGSGFLDKDGQGNGGQLAGYCKCDGVEYGNHRPWGIKRIELHENNVFTINDAPNYCHSDVTDAMEFEPALVIDGKPVSVGDWTGQNPRACIGQADDGGIMMLVLEGRRADSPGCSLAYCRDKLVEYRCWTAMNLDGGTSAILWYNGEEISRCSNASTPKGRPMPNAWIYSKDPVD